MSEATRRRYSAGTSLQDYCRPCKIGRLHTVLVASPDGEPLRVICDHCGSQHNYRGNREPRNPATVTRPGAGPADPASRPDPFFPVTPRERSLPAMTVEPGTDLEMLLRRIIREETGLTPVAPADKWHGGELVLRPGKEGVQEKSWPIETFFHKVVMVRNRLRTLEQQINGSDLPEDVKVKLQGYITGCYGSLTSFNVLFADDDDRFRTK